MKEYLTKNLKIFLKANKKIDYVEMLEGIEH